MPPTTRGAAFLASLVAISACVSQSAIRGPAAQFSQATLTAVSAEQALLDDVDHAAESAKTALLRARWNSNHQSFQPEDMIPPSPAISPEARKSIEQLLETVRLYGQALQALATDGATGTLDQNTKNIATGLQKFDAGVLNPLTGSDKPVLPATAVDGVVAGVRAVADFAIGRIIAKDVQQAARDRDGDLKAVVEALKQINTRYGDIADDEIARELRGANTSVLRSGKATMADFDSLTAQGRSMALATDPRKANAALDALVTSNNAIATAGPGGAWAEVQAFVQAATDAYNYYKSLPQ